MNVAPAWPAAATDPAGPARDRRLMRLALSVGARHLGRTAPNPSVGAVVADAQGRVVAVGVTQPGGRPHAERVALEAAGAAARGATLYVTLEPCAHVSTRGPSCVAAVREFGIARCVIAMADPDPRTSGRGAALLREAGVAVEVGLLAEEAARAHRGHALRVGEGRPAVTLKLARTADGHFARPAGPRLMITGPTANGRTHLLRAHADAILVGSGTALADDPRLDVRLPGLEGRRPARVVIDGALRLSPDSHLVATARAQPTWVVATDRAPVEAERRLKASGVEVMRVSGQAGGRVDLRAALELLALRGVTRVLCEGGPTLADALAAEDLVDELVLITARTRFDPEGSPALHLRLMMRLATDFSAGAPEIVGPEEDEIVTYQRRR